MVRTCPACLSSLGCCANPLPVCRTQQELILTSHVLEATGSKSRRRHRGRSSRVQRRSPHALPGVWWCWPTVTLSLPLPLISRPLPHESLCSWDLLTVAVPTPIPGDLTLTNVTCIYFQMSHLLNFWVDMSLWNTIQSMQDTALGAQGTVPLERVMPSGRLTGKGLGARRDSRWAVQPACIPPQGGQHQPKERPRLGRAGHCQGPRPQAG